MPFDGDENFYDKGQPSLASVVNRFGYKVYTREYLAKHMNAEQNTYDAGFLYYNRFPTDMGLLFFVISLLWVSIEHSDDMFYLISSLVLVFVTVVVYFIFEPAPPACWSETTAKFIEGTLIPTDGINAFNTIKNVLPYATAKIGKLTKDGSGNFGSYLIVRHEQEEVIIGIWTGSTI